ncbi:scrapie-responsive protein 1 isoform X1 [Salmo salar]|uniref:Scrapie-responsive protein 1 isoform X1 n=2 Tax=Salmo salar TaxID=8030 RepID=A0ABM3ENE8_SALSA|nr:scrapie-responsive protein 1 isoform X1 [Salmo salar]
MSIRFPFHQITELENPLGPLGLANDTEAAAKLANGTEAIFFLIKMKPLLIAAILLVGLLAMGSEAIPSNRWSCYKKVLKGRDCRNVGISNGVANMRPIDSLQNHFWEGNKCDMVCYCNFSELLCCPRDVFFGPKISFIIPCKTI